MHDMGGFALLLIGLLLAAIVLFQYLLPLLLTWTFGTLSFLVAAFFLVRQGRVHPAHLDAYLRPGLSWLLLAAALGLPAAHALYLFLTDPGDRWPWIAAANALVPIGLAARHGVRHLGQKRRYVREGHDIEDLLDGVRARIATIEVKTDLLSLAASLHEEPEPWERVAGLDSGDFAMQRRDHEIIEARLAAVRAELDQMAVLLEGALGEVRAGMATPHPATTAATTRLQALQAEFDQGIAQAQAAVAEVLPGAMKPAV
jgi:hypothetical protein